MSDIAYIEVINPNDVGAIEVIADDTDVQIVELHQFNGGSGGGGSGTVTSVALSVPTGLAVSGSPITSSGTLAVSYGTGYAIPTTAKQAEWDTAYSWGDHASAGYTTNTGTVTSVNASTSVSGLSFSGGPVTGSGTLALSGTVSAVTEGAVTAHQAALSINQVQISDLDLSAYAEYAALISTSSGLGASLVGIEDAGGLFAATTVEGALAEAQTAIDALEAAGYLTGISGESIGDLSDVTITTATTGDLLRWNGTAWVNYADSAYATAGHNHTGTYQPLDADLTAIAALANTDGNFIVGNGTAWVAESGATARTSLGLGTAATAATGDFEASGSIATHAAVTSGVHGISAFGADLVDDADAATARTTLGLVIGTNVQAFNSKLSDLAGLSYASNALKVVRVNAGETGFELATISAGGIGDGDTLSTGLTFPNTGLHILDTNASHDLILAPGSDLTSDRTLTITTGDASRTLTLSGDATISGTNSGDVSLTGTPDYITISGQVITVGAVDLAADVSGTLPVANGGTGATSLPTPSNYTATGATVSGHLEGIDTALASAGGGGSIKYSRVTSDQNVTSTSLVDATSLSFTAAANTDYRIYALIIWNSSASTEGPSFAINGPASPNSVLYRVEAHRTGAFVGVTGFGTAYETVISQTTGSTSDRICLISGLIRNGANSGTVTVRVATETGGAQSINILTGSYLEYAEVTT